MTGIEGRQSDPNRALFQPSPFRRPFKAGASRISTRRPSCWAKPWSVGTGNGIKKKKAYECVDSSQARMGSQDHALKAWSAPAWPSLQVCTQTGPAHLCMESSIESSCQSSRLRIHVTSGEEDVPAPPHCGHSPSGHIAAEGLSPVVCVEGDQ